MEELHNHELQLQNGGNYSRRSGSNGPHIEHPTLKSNLKKTTIVDGNQLRLEKRKVSWPDAHGKDIAHVHEFEPRGWGTSGSKELLCLCYSVNPDV
ncbi:hypothetical protein RGQ29_023126 [Quercus rubra]|uniref:Uncharacterized protein n=1 Tax=Quercus rubra TaxID=3512 RepID=A0AAN7ITM6_QUERU|nr:hypothetical protein RGQ29_023126 [Quercus rubra]